MTLTTVTQTTMKYAVLILILLIIKCHSYPEGDESFFIFLHEDYIRAEAGGYWQLEKFHKKVHQAREELEHKLSNWPYLPKELEEERLRTVKKLEKLKEYEKKSFFILTQLKDEGKDKVIKV